MYFRSVICVDSKQTLNFLPDQNKHEFKIMAAGGTEEEDLEKMEEGDDDWEYYDDNDVLPDFWQDFVTNEIDFSRPLSIWMRSFTKPMGNYRGPTEPLPNIITYRERLWMVHVQGVLAGVGAAAAGPETGHYLGRRPQPPGGGPGLRGPHQAPGAVHRRPGGRGQCVALPEGV